MSSGSDAHICFDLFNSGVVVVSLMEIVSPFFANQIYIYIHLFDVSVPIRDRRGSMPTAPKFSVML